MGVPITDFTGNCCFVARPVAITVEGLATGRRKLLGKFPINRVVLCQVSFFQFGRCHIVAIPGEQLWNC